MIKMNSYELGYQSGEADARSEAPRVFYESTHYGVPCVMRRGGPGIPPTVVRPKDLDRARGYLDGYAREKERA